MSTVPAPPFRPPSIIYPETDGEPIAENTLQLQWIMTIINGLDDLFAHDPEVFVAGDLLWYPVEGHPEIVTAPDAMVAFGRPKGHRASYRQWEEGGIAPQVVFEVLSPSNRLAEMTRKMGFYRTYGVEEYYVYDPAPPAELSGFLRKDGNLVRIDPINGHVSHRLGVKFEMTPDGLQLIRPDGKRFLTNEEKRQRAEQADQRLAEANQRAEQERQRADAAVRELDELRRQLGAHGPGAG